MRALFKYFICITLVPTSTPTSTQVIGYSNASRNRLERRDESALVERTV
jgi:hypothetical protein